MILEDAARVYSLLSTHGAFAESACRFPTTVAWGLRFYCPKEGTL